MNRQAEEADVRHFCVRRRIRQANGLAFHEPGMVGAVLDAFLEGATVVLPEVAAVVMPLVDDDLPAGRRFGRRPGCWCDRRNRNGRLRRLQGGTRAEGFAPDVAGEVHVRLITQAKVGRLEVTVAVRVSDGEPAATERCLAVGVAEFQASVDGYRLGLAAHNVLALVDGVAQREAG